jgi:hypothetical protein
MAVVAQAAQLNGVQVEAGNAVRAEGSPHVAVGPEPEHTASRTRDDDLNTGCFGRRRDFGMAANVAD